MRKTAPWRLYEGFSLGRYVIEIIAFRYAVEREYLSTSALKFHTEDESQLPLIPKRKRKGVLQYASNILNALSRKRLVYLVKRKYVLNVPRILYLYHVYLSKDSELCQNKDTCPLALAAGGIIQSLGEASFSRERAISLVKDLVERYYGEYRQFLNVLDNFLSDAVKLYRVLNEPLTSQLFKNEVMKLLDDYLFDIINYSLTAEPEEFVKEFAKEFQTLIARIIKNYELVDRIVESWRQLNLEVGLLVGDDDFRVASYARKFMYKVIRIELASQLGALVF